MTKRDLELIKQRFPVSEAVARRSLDAVGSLQNTVPEPAVRKPAQIENESKERSQAGPRLRVKITSYRCRLLDPDNLCPKFLIDALRYQHLITDDSPEHIILEVRQQKVARKPEEGTLVEICHA